MMRGRVVILYHQLSKMNTVDTIFNDLKNGTLVGAHHPQIKDLRDASYATIRLLQQLNVSSNPEEDFGLLAQRPVLLFLPL